ncbi:MAG: alanine dehydrogenase [Gemmatimonadetes bacterium]|nr:alanine dehydrogenase [Gemmatimonadota bacterium]
MLIGVPKEIKPDEYRVALTPAGAEMLTAAGHKLVIEKNAGLGSGFTDDFYKAAGAEIVKTSDEVWKRAQMILKVKEPIRPEWPKIRKGQVLFTYFHFAADEELTKALLKTKSVAIAYETVELPSGELPLLTPMSEVAGRMAVQEGAKYLEKHAGGLGVLLGGVPGVLPGKVLILGGGVVGTNAAKMAAGMGARVSIMDVNLQRLRYLDDVMPANVSCLYSTRYAIRKQIEDADLIIGAVLIAGAKAPHLITKDDLKLMRPGTVLVDVAVDQGGCIETIKPTTHHDPVYVVDNVIHYAVANMPGGVPRTSTLALTNATLPYAIALANKGWKKACREDEALKLGVNAVDGHITYPAVAQAFGMKSRKVDDFLKAPKKAAKKAV